MDHYYLYLLDPNGRIKAREVLPAPDQNQAIAKAEAYLCYHPALPGVELWLGERRIKTIQQQHLNLGERPRQNAAEQTAEFARLP